MKILSTSLIAFFLLINLSCKKIHNDEPTTEELAAEEDRGLGSTILSVEGLTNEMEFIARELPNIPERSSFLNCASIASTTINGGKKYELAFNSGNTCTDNTIRSGKLIITYQTQTGDVLITTDNYVLSNFKIAGTYLFQPIVEQGKDLLKLTVANGQLTTTTGEFVKFNVMHKSEFKEGKATTNTFNDDVLETVSASYHLEIKNSNPVNSQYDAVSTSPYTLKYSCAEKFRPRAGKIKFQRVVGTDWYILLGSGGCSDLAKISPTP